MKLNITPNVPPCTNGRRPIDFPIPPCSSLGGGDDLFVPSVEQSNDFIGNQSIAKPNGITIEDLRLSPKLADSLSPVEQIIEAQSYLKSSNAHDTAQNLMAFSEAYQRELKNQPSMPFGHFSK